MINRNSIIPFNKPYTTENELLYISEAHSLNKFSGDGVFTQRCHHWLQQRTGSQKALLTHSCTAALEIAALLLDIAPGDEVIMPSYTYVSTANAFVLRGAIPVFVDIRTDTLNLNENLIEQAISKKTKAIVPVHYAGIACEMDTIMALAKEHRLKVIEDAAQGIESTYNGRALGSLGHLGAYSFHETKNISCGEGGALLINEPAMVEVAEIYRDKGTDRSRFFRGEVDKYSWQSVGSSYLPGELVAAFLWGQLEAANDITETRLQAWKRYHAMLTDAEEQELLRRPYIPQECKINGHMYFVILPPDIDRNVVIENLKQQGIYTVFHYVPLHSSKAGRKYGREGTSLEVTKSLSEQVLRLPLWVGLKEEQQIRVVDALLNEIKALRLKSVSSSN